MTTTPESDADKRFVLEILQGQRRELRWASNFVRRHSWDFLSQLHPKLTGLGDALSVGLSDVLKKHERLLFSPQTLLGRDEIKKLSDTLRQISDRLTWIGDAIFGPEGLDESSQSHRANKRLETLAIPKRGSTLKADRDAINHEAVETVARHHRLHLWLQLAEQIHRETTAGFAGNTSRGKAAGNSKGTRNNPLMDVIQFQLVIREWAQRATATRERLIASSTADHLEANTALVADLWALWQPHLSALGTTAKNRPIVEAPSSKLFLGIVGNLLKSFTDSRRQTDAPDQQYAMVRRKVQRRLRKD